MQQAIPLKGSARRLIQIILIFLIFTSLIYLYYGAVILSPIRRNEDDRNTLSDAPRIFDTVLLNDELDWLEVRMNELDKVVDVFVVIEAQQTFQRGHKPLYFQQASRDKRFERFMDRVLHIVVPNITEAEEARNRGVGGDGPWAFESYFRNKGIHMALQSFRPSPGDWVLHSDVDEIPRASALANIKASSSPPGRNKDTQLQTRVLDCNLYYYSFEFKRAEPRKGPVLAQFQLAPPGVDPNSDEPIVFNDDGLRILDKPLWEDWQNIGIRLRRYAYELSGPNLVENACWHCSWCFSKISYVRNKAASYSHEEHNTAEYMSESWIINHFREGKDLFERNEFYNYEGPPTDVPKFIADHPDRFSYLTHRYKTPNAGFLDVPENPSHTT